MRDLVSIALPVGWKIDFSNLDSYYSFECFKLVSIACVLLVWGVVAEIGEYIQLSHLIYMSGMLINITAGAGLLKEIIIQDMITIEFKGLKKARQDLLIIFAEILHIVAVNEEVDGELLEILMVQISNDLESGLDNISKILSNGLNPNLRFINNNDVLKALYNLYEMLCEFNFDDPDLNRIENIKKLETALLEIPIQGSITEYPASYDS